MSRWPRPRPTHIPLQDHGNVGYCRNRMHSFRHLQITGITLMSASAHHADPGACMAWLEEAAVRPDRASLRLFRVTSGSSARSHRKAGGRAG
jgi:hypothetical protein